MIGIDVGATHVTYSDGSRCPFETGETPRDLHARVLLDAAHVQVTTRAVELRTPEALFAATVAGSLRSSVTEPSSRIALAIPGWWPPTAQNRVHTALNAEGLAVTLVNDAEASVTELIASGSQLPETVVVVSARAETTSAVIVESCNTTPRAVRTPTMVHPEGGNHLDTIVLQHVVAGLRSSGHTVDTGDEDTVAAARQALDHCRVKRELLSTSHITSVDVHLPGAQQAIRLVRAEVEEVTAPWCDAVITMLRTLLNRYDRPVDAVVLTGGVAHMPLTSQRISADFGLDVHVPDAPTLVAARGAARVLEARVTAENKFSFARLFKRSPRTETPKAPLPRIQKTPGYDLDDPQFDDLVTELERNANRILLAELPSPRTESTVQ